MYDAALADISDRDALIGSMFHEILYVNSFYKDPADERLSDITSMTEWYISQFLIPQKYVIKQVKKLKEGQKIEINLFLYAKYLNETFPQLEVKEKIKIIITLQDFINYISYRSNGAPKKITRLFDEHIVSFPDSKDDFDSTIITQGDKRNLYLHFNYNDQYIFTVGKYLFNPFVIAVNKYISHFEDKLLVSTSFLLNHLYKFHKVGFSYNTLELTPEIIAIYKAPELRNFILRLIQFMNKTHIRKIISGLYDFKFHSKLEKEIAFVSKISEKESAALNFTLDESLIIKSIFRSQLKNLKSYWKGKKEIKYNLESLTIIYSNLGDLNFNDNQFFEAIHYYKEALIPYKNSNVHNISPDIMIVYLRIYLKLGLSFEMVRNMGKAMLIYETIYSDSVKYVEECLLKKNWNKYSVPKENPPLLTIQRVFYQALIAKLHVIEKSTIKSLTKNQVNSNIKEFNSVINKYLEPEQKFLLKSEYNNKLGDLLFYKNGILFGKIEEEKSFIDNHISEDHTVFEKLIEIQRKKDNLEHLYALPISGYKHYMISLANLVNIGIDEKFNSRIIYFDIKEPEKSEKLILHYFTDFLFRGAQKDFPLTRRSFYLASANALSDAGDAILIFGAAELNNNKDKTTISLEKLKRILKFDLQKENTESYSYDRKNEWHIKEMYENIKDENLKDKFRIKLNYLVKNIEEFRTDYINLINNKNTYNNFYDNLVELMKNLEIDDKDLEWIEICKKWEKIDELRNDLTTNYRKFVDDKISEINKLKKKKNYAKINEIEAEINKTKQIFNFYDRVNRIFGNDRIEKIRKIVDEEIYNDFDRFYIALRYYIISAGYFLKSEDYKEYVFQMTKILHVFRVYIQKFKIDNSEEFLNLLKKEVVEKAIRYNFKAYKNYNVVEEQKLLKTLNLEGTDKKFETLVHTATSASEDMKEIVILYKEIELMLGVNKNIKIENSSIGPYTGTSLELNRLHELNYKNHYNYALLKQMLKKSNNEFEIKSTLNTKDAKEIINTIYYDNTTSIEELEFVILDSLFTLFKMHKTLEIFGLSFIHNHSWYASIYRRIAVWTQLYKQFEEITVDRSKTESKLRKLIGIVELNDLNPISYYEKALSHCYSIYSSHFEGGEYYDIIGDMNYLDDDFNDPLYHFSATMERVVINLGIIEKHIKQLKKLIKDVKRDKTLKEYTVDYYM